MDRTLFSSYRLRSCQAWVYKYDNGDMMLFSYNTPVAVYFKDTNTLYKPRRFFSNTTCQHQSKFKHDIDARLQDGSTIRYRNSPEYTVVSVDAFIKTLKEQFNHTAPLGWL